MKSTKLQLLVVLAAVLVSAAMLFHRGLPPKRNIFLAVTSGEINSARRALCWGVGLGPDERGLKFGFAFQSLTIDSIHTNTTPLHAAIYGGQMDIAELLLAYGADIDARDSRGWTPLYYAVYVGRWDLAEWLVWKGATINAQDADGWTPLHAVAAFGDRELALLLIHKGADINTRDKSGRTPLKLAIQRGDKELADMLRRRGAKE